MIGKILLLFGSSFIFSILVYIVYDALNVCDFDAIEFDSISLSFGQYRMLYFIDLMSSSNDIIDFGIINNYSSHGYNAHEATIVVSTKIVVISFAQATLIDR